MAREIESFGRGLTEIMRIEDVTCEILSEWMGVSRVTICDWRAGKCFPHSKNLRTLEGIFRRSADDITRIGERVRNG